jgi:hypothetical protein
MPKRHQFFGQVGDDPLGAPIKTGWNTLHKGRDLRNLHRVAREDTCIVISGNTSSNAHTQS